MTVLGVCLILTITEIVLLARHKLQPLTFLITNVIKSIIWVLLFILEVVTVVDNHKPRTASAVAIIIEAVLLYVLHTYL